MTLELADGRGELFQWDAGRIIEFGDDTVSQAHFTSIEKITDIPYTIEVKNRKAAIPDELLQVPGTLIVYAWVSDTNGGYTKVQVNFPVFARPKPSDYVYTPTEHAGFDRLRAEIGDLSTLQTTAKDNLVAAINEAAASGGADWNQNDPTAKDYVKNRPGGYDVVTPEKIISERKLKEEYMDAPVELSEPLVVGRSYRCTFYENAPQSNTLFDDEVVAEAITDPDSVNYGGIIVIMTGYGQIFQPATYPEKPATYSGNKFYSHGYFKIVSPANTEAVIIPDKYTNAITYTPQTLTDVQKKQARENVDAASDFVIKTTNQPGDAITLDKTFAEITEAVARGKRASLHLIEGDAAHAVLYVTDINSARINFESTSNDIPDGVVTIRVTVSSHDDVTFVVSIAPVFNLDGTMPQTLMAAAPTEDMQIATKKFVEDTVAGAGGGENFELIMDDTVPANATGYANDKDINGESFALREWVLILWTPAHTDDDHGNFGRAAGFIPASRWGLNVFKVTDTVKKSDGIGRYDMLHIKVVSGYQMQLLHIRSQNATTAFGVMQQDIAAGAAPINFKTDATALFELTNTAGYATCVKIVGYSNENVPAGTHIKLYGKRVKS